MTEPQTGNLLKHLRAVARPRDPFENPEVLSEIQAYIEDQFRSFGYRVEKQSFSFEGREHENVIARTERIRESEGKPRFLIGAHFDAVGGTDGADDNASGVAVLLEAARRLAENRRGQAPEGTSPAIEFAAFNLEEYGMAGSTAYVKQQDPPDGMISLEMVGYTDKKKGSQKLPLFLKPFYPDVGNFIALVGDGNSKKLLGLAGAAFRAVAGLPVETLKVHAKGRLISETRLSDHAPFWDAGIPALLVTDTSFFRNPHYHTSRDKVETLDVDFIRKVTEGVVQLANSLPR